MLESDGLTEGSKGLLARPLRALIEINDQDTIAD